MISAVDEGKRRIRTAISSGRLSHAVLLKGDSFVCAEIVRAAAALIFNKSEKSTDEIADFLHVDGKTLRVESGKSIIDELNVTPSSGKRVIEFSDAGHISVIVQNMLLKTIEEPPPGNTFFFYGHESGLLPTILSRCAVLSVGQLCREDMAMYVQRAGAGESDAIYYASLGGSVEDALRLYRDEAYRSYCISCAEYICSLGKKSLFSDEQRQCAQGDALKCSDIFDLVLSDMRRIKMGLVPSVFTRSPHNMTVKECADRLTEKQIDDISALTAEMHKRLGLNTPAVQVFDDFAAKAEQVIGYGQ